MTIYCQFEPAQHNETGKTQFLCVHCGRLTKFVASDAAHTIALCRAFTRPPMVASQHTFGETPHGLVGDGLHNLIASLGIKPKRSCNCEAMRQKMNQLGPTGCREHKSEIIEHLRTAYKKTDWPSVFSAALRGATHLWLVRRINPLHPIESGLAAMVDEAIERAEKQGETTPRP